jgi:predicted nucleotidyltransferase
MFGMVNVMASRAINDPVLKRFRDALDHIYGNRLERVVLFGSRARGDARNESDYDVAVFIKELNLPSRELDRLADIETDILYDTGAVINALPFSAGRTRHRPASCTNCGETVSICDAGSG